jgi:hypothetical protein
MQAKSIDHPGDRRTGGASLAILNPTVLRRYSGIRTSLDALLQLCAWLPHDPPRSTVGIGRSPADARRVVDALHHSHTLPCIS